MWDIKWFLKILVSVIQTCSNGLRKVMKAAFLWGWRGGLYRIIPIEDHWDMQWHSGKATVKSEVTWVICIGLENGHRYYRKLNIFPFILCQFHCDVQLRKWDSDKATPLWVTRVLCTGLNRRDLPFWLYMLSISFNF